MRPGWVQVGTSGIQAVRHIRRPLVCMLAICSCHRTVSTTKLLNSLGTCSGMSCVQKIYSSFSRSKIGWETLRGVICCFQLPQHLPLHPTISMYPFIASLCLTVLLSPDTHKPTHTSILMTPIIIHYSVLFRLYRATESYPCILSSTEVSFASVKS